MTQMLIYKETEFQHVRGVGDGYWTNIEVEANNEPSDIHNLDNVKHLGLVPIWRAYTECMK